MDYYMNENNVVTRLVEEWKEHSKLIIAYDFDSTVFDYNTKGYKYDDVIELLQECNGLGAYYVCFTSCNEDRYKFIKDFLQENMIPCDKINENIDIIPFTGRKIYYNILLDDRSGLKSAYDCLRKALGTIYLEKIIEIYKRKSSNKKNIQFALSLLSKFKLNAVLEILDERLEKLYRRDLIFNSSKQIEMLENIIEYIIEVRNQ